MLLQAASADDAVDSDDGAHADDVVHAGDAMNKGRSFWGGTRIFSFIFSTDGI